MAGKNFTNKKNRDNALKMLKAVDTVLKKFNIDYYLDYGTLLGAARSNGFIPWDDDMDITIANSVDYEKIPKVLKELEKQYKYKTRLYTIEDAIKRCKKDCDEDITFTNKSNYQIAKIKKKTIFGGDIAVLDLFFKYKKDNRIFWYSTGLVNSVDAKYLEKGFKEIKFYDLTCKIPIDYNGYLSSIYGNWREENSEWTCQESFALSDVN